MKILFCNKYNYLFSGTEVYLFETMELIRSMGHEAALFSMADPRGEPTPYDRHFMPYRDFKGQSSWFHRARTAANVIYSVDARRRIRAMIREFRPDVAHVRNIYHHLSPSILWELKAQDVPVLYHLNDFKVLCPSYNLVSSGEACEACKGGKFWHMLPRKCYPGRAQSITLVAEAYFHKWVGTYRKCVDRFLAPSQFVRDKFVEHGWDAAKFEVLPHFQLAKPVRKRTIGKASLLYFGRLSQEKGVEDLLHAMQRLPHVGLVVAGDGPERSHLQQLGTTLGLSNVVFMGHMQGIELSQAIADSSFTVLPSHAYETLGKTILESYAHARAVIASDLGSRRELVHEGKTGLLYKSGDVTELASAIEFLSARPDVAEKMGQAGRELVEKHYRPEAHYEKLVDLYERLAASKKKSAQPARHAKKMTAVNICPQRIVSETAASPNRESSMSPAPHKRILRIAFIGGRGVISKYSGIENYYEEVGKRLTGMGHEVTAYCRTYFTPAVREHNGIRVVRLPTLRSKHLETLLHTMLSTLHVLMQPCDVVHYHALGPSLFSFLPRLAGKKTVVTVQGLDWKRKNGALSPRQCFDWESGRRRNFRTARSWFRGHSSGTTANAMELACLMCPTEAYCGNGNSRTKFSAGGWRRGTTFFFWEGSLQKRVAAFWLKPSNAWIQKRNWYWQEHPAIVTITRASCELTAATVHQDFRVGLRRGLRRTVDQRHGVRLALRFGGSLAGVVGRDGRGIMRAH